MNSESLSRLKMLYTARSPYKIRGVFSKPVCAAMAKKAINVPLRANQTFSTSQAQQSLMSCIDTTCSKLDGIYQTSVMIKLLKCSPQSLFYSANCFALRMCYVRVHHDNCSHP